MLIVWLKVHLVLVPDIEFEIFLPFNSCMIPDSFITLVNDAGSHFQMKSAILQHDLEPL